jgi:ABC-type spermidine/putrescine transport system permease subunit II
MALILYSRENAVISTVVWQFWGQAWVPEVAALRVVLVVFALVVVGGLRLGLSRLWEVGSGA